MTDIVKKLRDDASITSEFAMTQDDYTEAADTIETLRQRIDLWKTTAKNQQISLAELRQRVNELELVNVQLIDVADNWYDKWTENSRELAALKQQSDPVAYGLFMPINGELHLQTPINLTKDECLNDLNMYHQDDRIGAKVLPLYTAPPK